MDADTRAELRQGLETLVRAAGEQSRRHGRCSVMAARHGAAGGGQSWQSVYLKVDSDADPPPLTPAQQLALSVLLEDEAVFPQVLADYLLDHGHEYATAVARTAAEAERRRCLEAIGYAARQLRVLMEEAPDTPLTCTPQAAIDLFEWARGEVESADTPPDG